MWAEIRDLFRVLNMMSHARVGAANVLHEKNAWYFQALLYFSVFNES